MQFEAVPPSWEAASSTGQRRAESIRRQDDFGDLGVVICAAMQCRRGEKVPTMQ